MSPKKNTAEGHNARISTSELAKRLGSLKEKPQQDIPDPKKCPLCFKPKEKFYTFCFSCFQKAKKEERQKDERNSTDLAKEHDKLKKKLTRLPAKNRKKSAIIDALMSGESIPQKPTAKPKTIRHKSIESVLESHILLKKLESF